LVVLAEHQGEWVSRRRLAELVWPSSGDRSARDSLRTALSALRRALPESALSSDLEQVCLAVEAVRIVTSPMDGEFMPDFDDDWVLERRLQDRATVLDRWLQESRALVALADPAAALERVEMACARDPLDDQAAALRIEVLERLGKRSEAVAVSCEHRRRVLRDLGSMSAVRPTEPAGGSPLVTMAEWLIERDPAEAVAFLASTRPHWEVVSAAKALDVHRRVLQTAAAGVPYRASVEAQALYLQWCFCGIGPNLSPVEVALDSARSSGDIGTAHQLANILAFSYLSAGRFSLALELVGAWRRIAKSGGDQGVIHNADMVFSVVHEHAGNRTLARSIKRSIGSGAEDASALVEAAQKYLVRALVAFDEDDLLACDEALQKARSAFASSDGNRLLGYTRILEAQLLDRSGDALRARDLLAQVLNSGDEVIGHSAMAMASDLLAGIDYRLGEFASAAERLDASETYRSSLGTVASPLERRRTERVRRKLMERFGSQHLARVRLGSLANPLG
jgi:tetratricopeptide (TPR) repeat protein